MLVLTRKLDEAIQIGDDIKITVLRVKGNTVRIGIEAPKSIRVVRDELEREGSLGSGLAAQSGLVGQSRLAAGSHRPANRIEAFVKEASNVVTSVVDSPASQPGNGQPGNSQPAAGQTADATAGGVVAGGSVGSNRLATAAADGRVFVGKLNTATGQARLNEAVAESDSERLGADQAAPLRAFLKASRPWQIAG